MTLFLLRLFRNSGTFDRDLGKVIPSRRSRNLYQIQSVRDQSWLDVKVKGWLTSKGWTLVHFKDPWSIDWESVAISQNYLLTLGFSQSECRSRRVRSSSVCLGALSWDPKGFEVPLREDTYWCYHKSCSKVDPHRSPLPWDACSKPQGSICSQCLPWLLHTLVNF